MWYRCWYYFLKTDIWAEPGEFNPGTALSGISVYVFIEQTPTSCISPDSSTSGPWNIVLTRQSESHMVIWQRTRPGYCGVITQSIWSDMTALVNRWPDTNAWPMGPSRRTGTRWKGLEPDIAVHVWRVVISTGSGLECGVTEWDRVTEGWGICR